MFSSLIFVVDSIEVEFSATELILMAQQVVDEELPMFLGEEIIGPDHEKFLDDNFWRCTKNLTNSLETSYGIERGSLFDFITFIYSGCKNCKNEYKNQPHMIYQHLIPSRIVPRLTIVQTTGEEECLFFKTPKIDKLLETIQTKEKDNSFELPLDKHIFIPMALLHPTYIRDWLFISDYLAKHYLTEETTSGWWFKIGGRVIRLRNDATDGAVAEKNKQFYSGDHGFEKDINERMPKQIQRCIESVSWDSNGTWFRACKFFVDFYHPSRLQELKNNFVELATDEILDAEDKGKTLFLKLAKERVHFGRADPISIEHLTQEVIAARTKSFEESFSGLADITEPISLEYLTQRAMLFKDIWARYIMASQSVTSDFEQVKKRFIAAFPDDKTTDKEQLRTLLVECFDEHFRPGIVPYRQLPQTTLKKREKRFNELVKHYTQQHQAFLRKEFIARLNDEIAESPKKCQLLLLSLASADPNLRASTEENTWTQWNTWALGNRGLITKPEVLPDETLSEEAQKKYGAIFDDLIEQFHYIFYAILTKRHDLEQEEYADFFLC